MQTREKRKQLADQVKYSYFNIGETGAVATLATIEDVEEAKLFYGVSVCCPTDRFVRSEGKNLARQRLFDSEGKNWILWPSARNATHDAKRSLVSWFLEETRPHWLVDHSSGDILFSFEPSDISYRIRRTRKTSKKPKKLSFFTKHESKVGS